MAPGKFRKAIRLYKGPNEINSDMPLRHYKYINSVDLSFTNHPINPILKRKLLISLKNAKILRKLKIDDDNDSEDSLIFKPYRNLALRHCQSLTTFSNYVMADEAASISTETRRFVRKLKALTRYKSYSISPRDLKLIQRSLKSLDLDSSKFMGQGFKDIMNYLIGHIENFTSVQDLFLASRLTRDRENILEMLPAILKSPRFKNIRLTLLYVKKLPQYDHLPAYAKQKVKDLVMLMDNHCSATDVLPSILAFKNLQCLSIGNVFKGFTVDESDSKNWRQLERLNDLRTFSLEISSDNGDVRSAAMLFNSLRLPKRLEKLKMTFHGFPLDRLMDNYYLYLDRFMQNLANLGSLSMLGLTFESESSKRLQDITDLLVFGLKDHENLKEVSLSFSSPKLGSTTSINHAVLEIPKLLQALKGSSQCLEKLTIKAVKGELNNMQGTLRFPKLEEINIAVEERMDEAHQVARLLGLLDEARLKKLDLNFRTHMSVDDLLALRGFRNLEHLKVIIMGELIGNSIQIFRKMLVNSLALKTVWIEFPDLDFREESRMEEMVITLLDKKRLRNINFKTKLMKYVFDRNLHGNLEDQSTNDHQKMFRFIH